MPDSSRMAARSTSWSGFASRSFIDASSVCPPARALPPAAASLPASPRLVGRSKVNAYMLVSCVDSMRRRVDGFPAPRGAGGHVEVLAAEVLQRIEPRFDPGGGGADGTG